MSKPSRARTARKPAESDAAPDVAEAARQLYAEKLAQPAYLIRRAHQISVAIFEEEFAALKLTPVQYSILLILRLYPGSDQTSAASLAAIDKTSCWRGVEKLAARQLITVRFNAQDRRKRELDLTAAGAALLDRALPRSQRVQERLLEAMTRAERDGLLGALRVFVAKNDEFSRAPAYAFDDGAK